MRHTKRKTKTRNYIYFFYEYFYLMIHTICDAQVMVIDITHSFVFFSATSARNSLNSPEFHKSKSFEKWLIRTACVLQCFFSLNFQRMHIEQRPKENKKERKNGKKSCMCGEICGQRYNQIHLHYIQFFFLVIVAHYSWVRHKREPMESCSNLTIIQLIWFTHTDIQLHA